MEAVCVSSASTDLCGACRVTGIPTAIYPGGGTIGRRGRLDNQPLQDPHQARQGRDRCGLQSRRHQARTHGWSKVSRLPRGDFPFYSPSGHIHLPFSLDTLKATGDAFPITENGRAPTVAAVGTLVYSTGQAPEETHSLALSPDELLVAVTLDNGWKILKSAKSIPAALLRRFLDGRRRASPVA